MNKKETELGKKIKELEKIDEKTKEDMKKDSSINKEILKDFNPADLIEGLFSSDEVTAEKDKIIEILFEHEDIRKISDVTDKDLINIVVLLTFAKEVNVPLVTYFCDSLLTLSLSKDRKSREEIVEIYKTHMMGQELFLNTPEHQSRFSKLKDRLSL